MKLRSLVLPSCFLSFGLCGCGLSEFAARNPAADSSSKSAGATHSTIGESSANEYSSDSGAMDRESQANEPNGLKSCTQELQGHGFIEVSAKMWRKTINSPNVNCPLGFGYRRSEITIDMNQYTGWCPSTPTPLPNGSSFITQKVVEDHCMLVNRCGAVESNEALGRLAWVVKCKNQVPAFNNFLEAIRQIEGCTADLNNEPGKICLFSRPTMVLLGRFGASYFPHISFVHPESAEPMSALAGVATKEIYTKVDQLSAPAIQNQVTVPCPNPANVQPIDMVCAPGCYRGDQRIMLTSSGSYSKIKQAKRASVSQLAVLSRDSTLTRPQYRTVRVGQYTETMEESDETLLKITSASGIQLSVTMNHPLVDGSGHMREASDLKPGETLLRLDGRPDLITKIEPQAFFGKVYNVSPESSDPRDNLLVAEGLISGSHNFQTVLHSYVNRQILRSNLADGF